MQSVQRRNSTGTIQSFSSTTVSSLADPLTRQNQLVQNDEPNIMQNNENSIANRNNVRVNGSRWIQVGDIIHHNTYMRRSFSETSEDSAPLVSFENESKKNYCKIIVLILVILFILSAAIVSFFFQNINTVKRREIMYITRDEWGSMNDSDWIQSLQLPITRVIATVCLEKCTSSCDTIEKCETFMRHLQLKAWKQYWADIPYNFLICNDGNVYEGRGYLLMGDNDNRDDYDDFNDIGITVAFIGNFIYQSPSIEMLKAFENFLEYSVKIGRVISNYTVLTLDELKGSKDNLIFDSVIANTTKYYPMQRVYERSNNTEHLALFYELLAIPVKKIIISETGCGNCSCNTEDDCYERMEKLQIEEIKHGFSDFTNNFIIVGNKYFAMFMNAMGYTRIGNHTKNYNKDSYGIQIDGNFTQSEPNNSTINTLLRFFDDAVKIGKLSVDYEIYARGDLIVNTTNPGEKLMSILRTWSRFKGK